MEGSRANCNVVYMAFLQCSMVQCIGIFTDKNVCPL